MRSLPLPPANQRVRALRAAVWRADASDSIEFHKSRSPEGVTESGGSPAAKQPTTALAESLNQHTYVFERFQQAQTRAKSRRTGLPRHWHAETEKERATTSKRPHSSTVCFGEVPAAQELQAILDRAWVRGAQELPDEVVEMKTLKLMPKMQLVQEQIEEFVAHFPFRQHAVNYSENDMSLLVKILMSNTNCTCIDGCL